MSYVTTVILTFGVDDSQNCYRDEDHGFHAPPDPAADRRPLAIIHINKWLEAEGHPPLADIHPTIPGEKVAEMDVWGAAFNYLPRPEFLEAVKAAPWLKPERVVVVMSTHEQDGAAVWMPPTGWVVPPVFL